MRQWLQNTFKKNAPNPRTVQDTFKKNAPNLSIAAHVFLALTCVIIIAITSLSWASVFQAGMLGWALGMIVALTVIKRALQQNELTRRILEDFRQLVEKSTDVELENFVMRQYLDANNIEIKIERDGNNVKATAFPKDEPPAAAEPADGLHHPEGKDRTVH